MTQDVYAEVRDLIERAAVGHDKLAQDHPQGPDRHKADALRRFSQLFLKERKTQPKPLITLPQWLAIDPRGRKAPVHSEGSEICIRLIGESLTWRGRGTTLEEAVDSALFAREKIHGAAL